MILKRMRRNASILCLSAVAGFICLPASAERVLLVAQNAGTEITDLLVPYAVLAEAGVDVEIVSTDPGPVSLWPSLQLTGLRTVAAVDTIAAAWIVVPAVRNPQHPALLDGREATGHFYSARKRASRYPAVQWRNDRRFIFDENRLTSAGVSASAPAAVALVRRIKGESAAERVAAHFGIRTEDAHDAAAFGFGLRDGWTVIRNWVAGRRQYAIAAEPAVDEYSLAFAVDVLGRTNRVTVTLPPGSALKTLRGLTFEAAAAAVRTPDVQVRQAPGVNTPSALFLGSPAESVDRVFEHVASVFGADTARFIARQLEMPDAG